jgi:hypothetical protein
MNNKETARIKENLGKKTSDELLDIWTKNDRSEWSDETFVAIINLLTSRNVRIPEQEVYNPFRSNEKKLAAEKEMNKGLVFIVSALFVVFVSFLLGSPRTLIPIGLISVGAYILIKGYNEK